MSSSQHRTWVEIDRDALRHNVRELKKLLSPSTRFLAVVKANAYGHGLSEVAQLLADEAEWFGVDSVDEGLMLREKGVAAPILVLGWTPEDLLANIVRAGLRQVVYDHDTMLGLAAAGLEQRKPAKIHIKVETGTTRQGMWPEEVSKILNAARTSSWIVPEGIATHLANVEDTHDRSYFRAQLSEFKRALNESAKAGFPNLIRHVAASAAALLHPETHFDLVRVGIALYGIWPSPEVAKAAEIHGKELHLKPVLSWKTRIAQVKNVPLGTPVGYGLSEKVNRDSRIAVLPVGYFDGYDRALSRAGEVLIRGLRAKVLGRVCMNMIMVDVTQITAAKMGDEAVLIGEQAQDEISADMLAEKLGTIPYEVLSRINPLLPRVLI